jgi:2-iminobutanoate/2-iminopropanoate deaminase
VVESRAEQEGRAFSKSNRLSYHAPMSKLGSTIVALLVGVASSITTASAQDSKRYVVTPPGARPSPNFSSGIHVGDTLYVAGQTGTDPKTQKLPDNFEDEVKQCLANIGDVLHADKMDYSDVVAVTVYMTDLDLFQRMNAVYTGVFKDPRPTRTTVGITKLAAAGAHIEITVTARK